MTRHDKVSSGEIHKTLNVEPLFLRREISTTMIQLSDQNAPGKIGEASLVGYTQGKSGPESDQGPHDGLHLQPCMVPSWCRQEPAKLLDIADKHEVFQVPIGLMPPQPSWEER